jgi:hypothetical protein
LGTSELQKVRLWVPSHQAVTWRDSADVELVVTKYDIDTAANYNANKPEYYTNPIEHAVKRVLGRFNMATWTDKCWYYKFDRAECIVYYEGESREYEILGADRAAGFLRDWWYGLPVEPQRFTLRFVRSKKKE